MLDLVRADAGTIQVFGCDHRTDGAALRSRIAFVHDRPTCYDHLSVERLGALVASFYPTWDEEAFQRLTREFELPPRRKVSALSRGMRVKLALALALSHQAELLVLDEPTTGLDPVFRRELLERLSGLISDGRTSVLFSTQILSDLERIADYRSLPSAGPGGLRGCQGRPRGQRWAVVRGGPEIASELEGLSVRGARDTKMGIEALVEDIEATRRRFGERAVVERATLDDVFLLLGAAAARGEDFVTALLLKDLRVLRPWWWLIVPGHMLFGANGIISPESFFGMNVALACGYTVLLLLIDWKHDADRFVASLPVSREDMVKARYAGALGAAVCGTILYAFYGRVLLGFGGERLLRRWPGTPGWESVEGLLALFLVAWVVGVIYLPFHFRWGLGKGSWLFLASVALVVVVGAVLLRWLSVPWTLASVSKALAIPGTAIAALGGAAILGWLSLLASVRSYDRRDL